jgi:hypothetical protein
MEEIRSMWSKVTGMGMERGQTPSHVRQAPETACNEWGFLRKGYVPNFWHLQ